MGVSPAIGLIPGEEWEILKQYIMSNCIVICQDCLVKCKCSQLYLQREHSGDRFNLQLYLLVTV